MMFPLATEQTAVDRDAGSRGSAVGACGAAFEAPVAGMVAKCPPTLLHASGSGESGEVPLFCVVPGWSASCRRRSSGAPSALSLLLLEGGITVGSCGASSTVREPTCVRGDGAVRVRWSSDVCAFLFSAEKKEKEKKNCRCCYDKWGREKKKTRQVSSTRKDVRRAMELASTSPRVCTTIPQFAHLMVLTLGR